VFNYYADSVSFTTSASIHNNSRQGLQVRCHGTDASLLAAYYVGTYPNSYDNYSAGYYTLGAGTWLWPQMQTVVARTPGWHKFTIDVQPFTGANNEVKCLIDGTQVLAAPRTIDTQTLGMDMVAYGFAYRVNYPGWFDDCAMYASAPVAPTMGTPAALSSTAIRWVFTDNSNNEIGFKVQNAAQATVASWQSAVGTGTVLTATESGLTPNTPYTRTARAFNGTLDSLPTGSATRWTKPTAPTTSNVTCDKLPGWSSTATFTFTAVGGFGQGTVDYYRQVWDTTPTHVWTNTETKWDSGVLIPDVLSAGTYYLHVQAYNGEDVANGTLDLGPYSYQAEPPTNPTSAVETHGAANDVWQSTIAAPSFTWSGATASSGIAGYLVYFGDDSVGESTELVTSAAYTSAELTAGTYYLRLRTKDNLGNLADEWATLFTFKHETPIVIDDGEFTGCKTSLHATWTAPDPASGVIEWQYAVGTSIGAADVVGWTSALTATVAQIAIPDPGLVLNQDYFISAKVKNGAGVWSGVGTSDGIRLAPPKATIAAAKALDNDDRQVALSSKIITARFPASFYIEDADRSSGIIVLAPGYAPGALVTVGGTMGVNGIGERAILDPVVTLEADALVSRIPAPLFMVGRALGGKAFNAFTAGVTTGMGLNNVGLLVKVCGSVQSVSDTEITISDGSSTGPIKVLRTDIDVPVLTTTDFISVVGISSLDLDTVLKPVIRLRDGAGIVKLN
jgi:hypothetical protein